MFEVRFKQSVEKDLKALSKADQRKVLDQIEKILTRDPYLGKALSGEFKELYRWRTGRFKMIYTIQKEILLILALTVAPRKEL